MLSVVEIEEAIYPFLGEQRTAADVDMAREALENAYRREGFPDRPGRHSRSRGSKPASSILRSWKIRSAGCAWSVRNTTRWSGSAETAPSVAEGRGAQHRRMSSGTSSRSTNQPDLKVTPRLKPGAVPETVDVDLEVDDDVPLSRARSKSNNQYNQDTTPLRVVGSVSYNNLWQLGHAISLSYQIAPERTRTARSFPPPTCSPAANSPVSILAYGVQSDSDVAALANTNVVGRGTIFGARAIVNLPGCDGFFHSITAGIDRKNLTQNVDHRRHTVECHRPLLPSVDRLCGDLAGR